MEILTSSDRPVIVTGASGFVGKYVVKALRQAGVSDTRIVAVAQTEDHSSDDHPSVVQDLLDYAGIDRLIERLEPCAVLHLAAVSEPRRADENRDKAWNVNVEATRKLAESILAHAPDARLVFSGSSECYGLSFNDHEGPIKETAALRPITVYGTTKAAADLLLGQMQRDGLDCVRFRSFNHTGVGQRPSYVVPAFASQVAAIEKGEMPPRMRVGNLNVFRDFLDVRDVAAAYVGILARDVSELPKTGINLSSGFATPIERILETLRAHCTVEIEVDVAPELVRDSEVPSAAGDNQLLKSLIDWEPTRDLSSTLHNVLRSF